MVGMEKWNVLHDHYEEHDFIAHPDTCIGELAMCFCPYTVALFLYFSGMVPTLFLYFIGMVPILFLFLHWSLHLREFLDRVPPFNFHAIYHVFKN